MSNSTNLDKAFKFATFDKLTVLPGLDKKEIPYSYAVCKTCFEQIASGREKTERLLTRKMCIRDRYYPRQVALVCDPLIGD